MENQEKIHVLFFTYSLGGGGAEKHLLRILNTLDRQKFQLSLALSQQGGSYESMLSPDVKIHYLVSEGFPRSTSLRLLKSIGGLQQLIQTIQPDIICPVISHVALITLVAVRNLKSPPLVVVNVQNPPRSLYLNSWNITKRLIYFFIPRLFPSANKIVACAQGVADDLLHISPALASKIEVIYNAGVDPDIQIKSQHPIPLAVPDGSPLIVACGRLAKQKGFEYLLDAIAEVNKVVSPVLWILGEGELRPLLERKITALNLGDRVKLLGFQNNPYQFLARSDVFVLSSIFEGSPVIVKEAMACGCAIVASDCPAGGCREIIQDGVSGLLVPPKNVKELSSTILKVLQDSTLQKSLSEGALARSRNFDAECITQQFSDLFLKLIQSE